MTKTNQDSPYGKYRLLFRLFGQERGSEILKLMQEDLLDYRYGNYIANVIREIAIGKGQISESLEHTFPPTASSKESRVALIA